MHRPYHRRGRIIVKLWKEMEASTGIEPVYTDLQSSYCR